MDELISAVVWPDIPRVYTAIAEWMACMVWVLQSRKRWKNGPFVCIAAVFLVVQIVFMTLTAGADRIWWLVCIAGAVGIMVVFIYIESQITWMEACYHCVEAFVLAEFAASLCWQFYCYTNYNMNIQTLWLNALILAGGYALVFGIMYYISASFLDKEELELKSRELFMAVIIGVLVFGISNLGFINTNTPFSGGQMRDIFIIRTFIDLGGVAVLYAYHIQRQNLHIHYELDMMASLLEHQYNQYRQSRDTLDMINFKYHDLKHHIIALRAEVDDKKRIEYLDQMEESIASYEVMNKTGNKVLDILLTSKSLNCMNHKIDFTSVVDGSLLNFMDVMDICSIFGNALDNAIECEKKIEDKEKRMIHLSVFSQRSFVIIRCENYCEDEMDFEDSLPKTTKEGRGFHGYGLKSIRSTVQKYGGAVDVSVENNCFSLKILIPM